MTFCTASELTKSLDSERFEPQKVWVVPVTLSNRLLSNWLNINKKILLKFPQWHSTQKVSLQKVCILGDSNPKYFCVVPVTLSNRLLINWLKINITFDYINYPHTFLHSKWAFTKSSVSLGFEPKIFLRVPDTLSTRLLRNWVNVKYYFYYLNFPNDFLHSKWAYKKFGFWEIRTPNILVGASHLIH